MLKFIRTRLQQGTRTGPFPSTRPVLPERYRGRPVLDPARTVAGEAAAGTGPTNLVQIDTDGRPTLDVGAALFCPEEAAACAGGALRFSPDFAMASRTRDGLRSATGEVELATELDRHARRLFGRSLRLRSVVAGSCGGCEPDLNVLSTVVFDMARFGIQFVASPRHADGIVITGAVSRNMRDAMFATYAAMAEPRLVIAVGACAIDGGPFRGSPEVGNGVPDGLPVDLWVPGCPPHPLTVLDGLLRLLGRLPA